MTAEAAGSLEAFRPGGPGWAGVPVSPGLALDFPSGQAPSPGDVESALRALENQAGRRVGSDPPLILTVRAQLRPPAHEPVVLAGIGLTAGTYRLLEAERGSDDAWRVALDAVDTWRLVASLSTGSGMPSPSKPGSGPQAPTALVGAADPASAGRPPTSLEALCWPAPADAALRWLETPPLDQLSHALATLAPLCDGPAWIQVMPLAHAAPLCGFGTLSTRHAESGAPGLAGHFIPGHLFPATVPPGLPPLGVTAFRRQLPDAHAELLRVATHLEHAARDMVELDFVLQDGRPHVTDVRRAPRSPRAEVRVVVDLVEAGLIDPDEAVRRVTPPALERCFEPHFSSADTLGARARGSLLARGTPLAPGAACGILVTDPEETRRRASLGQPVIHACARLLPHHAAHIQSCVALLALDDAPSSFAAQAARAWSIPCIGAVRNAALDPDGSLRTVDGRHVVPGSPISLDGDTGEILATALPVLRNTALEPAQHRLLAWADRHADCHPWVTGSTPQIAAAARVLGAEGLIVDLLAPVLTSPEGSRSLEELACAALACPEASLEEIGEGLRAFLEEQLRAVLSEMQGFPTLVALPSLPLHAIMTARRSLGCPSLLSGLPRALLDLPFSRLAVSARSLSSLVIDAVLGAIAAQESQGQVIDAGLALAGIEGSDEIRRLRELVNRSRIEAEARHDIPLACRLGVVLETPAALVGSDTLAREADFGVIDGHALTRHIHGVPPSATFREGRWSPGVVDPSAAVTGLVCPASDSWRAANPQAPLILSPGRLGVSASVALARRLGAGAVACEFSRLPATRLACGRLEPSSSPPLPS